MDKDIKKAVRKEEKVSNSRNNQSSNMKVYLPYIWGVIDKISKIMKNKGYLYLFQTTNDH